MKVYEGRLNAEGFKFALIVSRFNSLITERLLDGAVDCLERHGNADSDREVIRVPGTWELPVAARWIVDGQSHDAVIALGCVIRGGTPHFEYVASEVTKGSASIAMASGVPVTLGVLTTDTIAQAIERAGPKHGNKGWEAAAAAIEMVSLRRNLG